MIRAHLLILFFLTAITCHGQFNFKSEFLIADSLKVRSIEWIDVNNDSLLDVLVVAKTPDSTFSFFSYKNLEGYDFAYQAQVKTEYTTLSYFLTDFDMDNAIDILASGTIGNEGSTVVFLNGGDFQFELPSTPLLPAAGSLVKMEDLNLDGLKELILSGGDVGNQVNVYSQTVSGWIVVNDSIKIRATDIITADFDSDLNKDILVTGSKSDNSFYSAILFNEGPFHFTNAIEIPGLSNSKAIDGDLNYDGVNDVFISGSQLSKMVISKAPGEFILKDTLLNQSPGGVFIADMNSDGRVDINITGLNEFSQPINVINFSTGEIIQLPNCPASHQRFGDTDRDGDLDLIQFDGSSIRLFENETGIGNNPPGKPSNPFAIKIFDRLFVYWDKSSDDHTPKDAVTYDLTVQSSNEEILIGDFDLFNKKRMLVSSGNNEAQHFTLLKNMGPGPFEVYIQSVDNAFHAGGDAVCHGEACVELNTTHITTCGAESIALTLEVPALWFSFNEGYLGSFEEYEYKKNSADTVFAFIPGADRACSAVKVFSIDYKDELTKKETETRYVCEGTALTLNAEPGWAGVTWSSALQGTLSHASEIEYTVDKQDTILLELTDNNGCHVQRETTLIISQPELSLPIETYQILKGESVQLTASGGDTYSWDPPTGLNDSSTANPTATPLVTTEYQVTAYDSIGCSSKEKVLVIVEETAFIPNLFTPNEDGKNDVLRIYGLSQAESFSLSIYNREGSLVYNTTNVQDASSNGWNGTVKGVLQPAGVYHWKVHGEYASGKRILLNGQETGSIILIR
ncbi:MAG TPA: gliding motility-associated C-terminal domain-containing protein [Cyclobacteriaceae bacterium]|nr:gliding motility-associated C-terminal domain-containing protein [Cyclobacteriaceae bacterium]